MSFDKIVSTRPFFTVLGGSWKEAPLSRGGRLHSTRGVRGTPFWSWCAFFWALSELFEGVHYVLLVIVSSLVLLPRACFSFLKSLVHRGHRFPSSCCSQDRFWSISWWCLYTFKHVYTISWINNLKLPTQNHVEHLRLLDFILDWSLFPILCLLNFLPIGMFR